MLQPVSYEKKALLHAEQYGIYSYTVKGNKMRWISYFGREGFYNVVLDLDTGKEIRKHQKSTTKEYNYFCG